MRRRGRAAAALTALALASCATLPPSSQRTGALADLPGWQAEDHVAAFAAVRERCQDGPAPAPRFCDGVLAAGAPDEAAARAFLETHFRARPIAGEGLLTAYFTPTYEARRARDAEFSAPVRPAPASLAGLPARAAIEAGPATGALAWMRPEDLFFLQIQGSGSLAFPDGGRASAVFAGSNGHPFIAISGPMAARGLLARAAASGDGLHAWLAAHRGREAQAVMRLDPRYVFFRLVPEDGAAPRGASGARLIAGRSLAVDPTRHPYFELLWIDADAPSFADARPAYRRLAVALDTGAAITGDVRADLYLGPGAAAGREAGAVRHALRLYRIVPDEGARP